jgi:hypothetical protein
MKNWFNELDAAGVLSRLDKLTPDAKPQWGRFTPGELLCHLADPVRVALGEKPARRVRGVLALPGLAHLVVWVLPWPKGAPTAPEFLPQQGMTNPTDFAEDKKTLLSALQRFAAIREGQRLSPSPVFGQLSRRGWGRLTWRHLDHHLRQFGL